MSDPHPWDLIFGSTDPTGPLPAEPGKPDAVNPLPAGPRSRRPNKRGRTHAVRGYVALIVAALLASTGVIFAISTVGTLFPTFGGSTGGNGGGDYVGPQHRRAFQYKLQPST